MIVTDHWSSSRLLILDKHRLELYPLSSSLSLKSYTEPQLPSQKLPQPKPTKCNQIRPQKRTKLINQKPTKSDQIRPNPTNHTKSNQIRQKPTKSNQIRPNLNFFISWELNRFIYSWERYSALKWPNSYRISLEQGRALYQKFDVALISGRGKSVIVCP